MGNLNWIAERVANDMITLLVLLVELLIILTIVLFIRSKIRSKDNNNKSSFELMVNSKNIEDKYKDLDMKSFDDIGGLHEVKEELKKYVKCFEHKEEFINQNVDIPKGILLWGPPGCGKTSLAKAIAYEAKVNFICRNASDLINRDFNRFNTLGSNKNAISKLFEDARKYAPCIVFIDELDVIGARYGLGGMPGVHQVEITKFLAEMDGFQNNKGIMVIAATNNIEEIDTALLRSGRLGKKYYVGPPISKRDILEVTSMYIKGKKLSSNITEDVLATIFTGSSPADIKNVLNECGVHSVLNNTEITVDKLRQAVMEVGLQTNLCGIQNMSKNRRKESALHEAGHAVVSKALGIEVQTVTILTTLNGVRGLTCVRRHLTDIDDDNEYNNMSADTVQELLNHAIICYGGLAVELYYGKKHNELNIGCVDDIRKASDIVAHTFRHLTYKWNTIVSLDDIGRHVTIVENKNGCTEIIEELDYLQNTAVEIIANNIEIVEELAKKLENDITIADDKLKDMLDKVKEHKFDQVV